MDSMLLPTRPVAPTTATFHFLLIFLRADTRFPLGEQYLKARRQIRCVGRKMTTRQCRHPRVGGDPRWIPAYAGMTKLSHGNDEGLTYVCGGILGVFATTSAFCARWRR